MKKGSQQRRKVPMTTPSVTKALCSRRHEELRRLRSLRTENTENSIVNRNLHRKRTKSKFLSTPLLEHRSKYAHKLNKMTAYVILP